ncbi:MAG: histidine kinase [Bacteroidales bacterium]|nr:histidine kinase [Bacteroidales bacterium]
MPVRHWITCCLLFITIHLSYQLKAQDKNEFRLENITSEYIRIEQGLSQNTVNCVLQDSKGFLWIGTWSGLNRFDGYSFRTLTRNFYEPSKGLTHSSIVGLIEDNHGYIWAATTKGLNRINPSNFSVRQYTTENSANLGFTTDSIFTIYYDSLGYIWLGTSQGAFMMNPITMQFTHYQHNPRDTRTLSDRHVTAFHEDNRKNIWIGTKNGLNYLIRKTGQIIHYFAEDKTGFLSSSYITAIEIGQEGFVWIGTPNGLNRLDPGTNWFEPYFLINQESFTNIASQNFITTIFNDSKNQMWVGTQEFGLYLFDKIGKQFSNMDDYLEDASILNSNTINTIVEDRTGLYWIGTSHRGLVKLVPEPHAFKKYLKGNPTYGITEFPRDTLWFGTQKGVYIFSKPMNRTIAVIEHEYNNPNSLTNNRVTDILHDGNDMWIATKNGLNKYNILSKKISTFNHSDQNNSIAGQTIWGITKAHDNTFWFATMTGVSHYFPETNSFKSYHHDPNNSNSISADLCYQVMEYRDNIFFISTDNGLNRYDANMNSWKVYLPIPGDLTSISAESIFGVFKDSHDELWVYTNGGGINRFDPVAVSFEHYTKQDGLADNTVYSMVEDDDGFFWLPTNNGLSRFDPVEEIFIKFDVQDGLLSNEFNINGAYETQNGEIFLAGANGITSFFQLKSAGTSAPPSIQITEFKVHESGNLKDIAISDQIKLNSDQNTFHVSFAALDYLNPFKNRFEYILDNYDKSWTSLDIGVHQVEYRKVPPGDYRLRIKGANSMGAVNETSVKIKIIAAWWQTLVFKILAISFSILFIVLFIRTRYIVIQRRHQMEKQILTIQNELVQSQKFALRSQMNPHFIFNSLNSIQNFVLKNDVDSANYYLSNFSVLMRKVLDYSQHNLITLHDELELIDLYIKMEKLRFSDKFDVEISIDPEIETHIVKIPPMLLQPYLENAILHGLQLIKHRGLLKISIYGSETGMDIVIEDNGIGRDKANAIRQRQAYKSKGLKNIEKRIQLYNKINSQPIVISIMDLHDKASQAVGTRVTLKLPYELDETVS